jgi:hypothetical protein
MIQPFDHFLGWRDPGADHVIDRKIGGVPLTPDCIIPDAMVIKFLKDYLARDDGWGEVSNKLRCLTLARLDAIPAECFKPDQRDEAVAAIESRQRIGDLLSSLDDDLCRKARRVVERHGGEYGCSLSKEEIVRLARSALRVSARPRPLDPWCA